MALEDDLYTLSRNPTLAALEPDALRQLALGAETRIMRKGEVLFRRDEPSDGGYVVMSGSVALVAHDTGYAEEIVEPPTLIGDMALITRTRRPATAIVREPSALLKISRQLFHRVLEESPRSAERLKRILADRLLEFIGELDAMAQNFSNDR